MIGCLRWMYKIHTAVYCSDIHVVPALGVIGNPLTPRGDRYVNFSYLFNTEQCQADR